MEAGTFKDLIVEAYKKSKEGNLVGTLYGAWKKTYMKEHWKTIK